MSPSSGIAIWRRKPLLLISLFALGALTATACGGDDETPSAGDAENPTAAPAARNFPIVTGYYAGEPIDYILAEVSDEDTAKLLSEKDRVSGAVPTFACRHTR